MSKQFTALSFVAISMLAAGCASAPKDDPSSTTECTRNWAIQSVKPASGKVIGLGLSTDRDARKAAEEAQAQAQKDILLQLQSSIDSRAEVKKTAYSSSFESNAVLTSQMDDLKAIKVIKEGHNADDRISKCVAAEFDAQAAYRDLSSQLMTTDQRFEDILGEDAEDDFGGDWKQLIAAVTPLRKAVSEKQAIIQRADTFKLYVGIPGPSWTEKFGERLRQLEKADRNVRSRLVFVLPGEDADFKNAVADVEGVFSRSGARAVMASGELKTSDIGVQLELKALTPISKSTTSLGETYSRRVSVRLLGARTGKLLAGSSGATISGTTPENLDAQVVLSVLESVRSLAPGLIK